MPFALLTLGILFIVIGFQDTYKQFGAQVASDSASFIWFLIAIGAVGALGYVKPLEIPSRAVLALIMIALFLGAAGKANFFTNFTSGIKQGASASVSEIGAPVQGASSGVSSGGSGSNLLGSVGKAAAIFSGF